MQSVHSQSSCGGRSDNLMVMGDTLEVVKVILVMVQSLDEEEGMMS